VRRREFLAIAGAAGAWPLAVVAQQGTELPMIGYLGPNADSVDRPRIAAFAQRLADLGWVEGHNVIIEHRAADGRAERADEIASEFVRRKVTIILTSGDAQGLAAKRATTAIPIVIAIMGDPVGSDLVASLARPGGNVTGLSMMQPDTAGKRLALLREVIPDLRRVAIFGNFRNRGAGLELDEAQAAARSLSLETAVSEIRRAEDLAPAIESLDGHADALYVCADPLMNTLRDRINTAALTARLPVMHSFRDNVEAGGLISYGPNILDLYRRAAGLVDKILHGSKPSDIPVEQPTKFELVINLKTAKALNLEISPALIARADEVIE
jgi:putative tryptophan/tyrosine transport system substrate-binding protein